MTHLLPEHPAVWGCRHQEALPVPTPPWRAPGCWATSCRCLLALSRAGTRAVLPGASLRLPQSRTAAAAGDAVPGPDRPAQPAPEDGSRWHCCCLSLGGTLSLCHVRNCSHAGQADDQTRTPERQQKITTHIRSQSSVEEGRVRGGREPTGSPRQGWGCHFLPIFHMDS